MEIKNVEIKAKDKKMVHVELNYPRIDNNIDTIEIGLGDVRAADEIRVQYDFLRDGWVIFQPTSITDGSMSTDYGKEWLETAFVPAWNLELEIKD